MKEVKTVKFEGGGAEGEEFGGDEAHPSHAVGDWSEAGTSCKSTKTVNVMAQNKARNGLRIATGL